MDVQAVNRRVIEQFRAGGEVEGMHRDRLLLLTTIGRTSGESRTTPMMFTDTDGEPMVVASNAGAGQHPQWFLNLEADPGVAVETPDGETWAGRAEPLRGEARSRRWAALVAELPFLADHQARAGRREIPLVLLHREAGAPVAQ